MTEQRIPQPPTPDASESTFISEPLLPTREIHLIAGGSGSGKSTFACQIAEKLISGDDFFGHPVTRPQKVGYLAFDRSHRGIKRTLQRASTILPIQFPFYSAVTSVEFRDPKYRSPDAAIDRFLELHPDTDVLIVDGIGMAFQGDSSSLSEVAKFVHRLILKLACLKRELTIIALHHMPKVKDGGKYAKPRERLHGSVAWAATCETCILIECEDESDISSPYRLIIICPRQLPERVFRYQFDEDGRLQRAAENEKRLDKMEALYDAIPLETELSATEVEGIGASLEISEASTKRYVNQFVMDHRLKRIKRGVYKRLKPN